MLKAKNIKKKYNDLEVLRGIDLEIKQGEIVSIVGASGAGKSTLLHILGTLDKADEGEIWLQEQNIQQLNSKELARFRNENIGFVFQFHNLMGEFTALENVMMPAWIGKKVMSDENIKQPKAESRKPIANRAEELLVLLGLKDRLSHLPSQLSGGEAQRVSFARALMNKPAIVFADEPTGNLDSKNAEEINQLFFDLREQFNQTFVIVTHNEQLANMADRKLVMQDGRIDMRYEI